MQLQPQQVVSLQNRQNQTLGSVQITRIDKDLVYGDFTAAPAFATVRPLFESFVAAVNEQMFAALDPLEEAMAALGLHLAGADGNGEIMPEITDVQIGGSAISFRFVQPPIESTKRPTDSKSAVVSN